MKKRIFILLSMALCFLMVMTGCGTTEVNQFGPTTLSTFDFYSQNVVEGMGFVSQNVAYVDGLGTADKAKINSVMSDYTSSVLDEAFVMACIECFNGVGVEDSSGTRVGYYEFDGARFKVSYDNAQRTYVVDLGLGDEASSAYSVSKADSVYNVVKKSSNGVPCSAVVQYDTTTSSMTMEITTKNSKGTALKIKKEMIVLKSGEIVVRDIVIVGDNNNKSIYTIEYIKSVFEAKVKIAKSNSDVGRINKETFDKETFASALSTDLAGYIITIATDVSDQRTSAVAFGEASAWIA